MRRNNDLGGLPAGPVDPAPHEPEAWQRLITALVTSVGPTGRRISVVDEFRRVREDLDKEFYDSLSYFELWAEGFVSLLEEKGVLTRQEVKARMAEMGARP